MEEVPAEDVSGGEVGDEPDLSTDAGRVNEEDVEAKHEVGAGEEPVELGVREDDVRGDLKVPEQDLDRTTETEASSSQVRRRNRRKRAKKVSH